VPELTFGFSPCPNDTFAFHAWVHGLVDSPLRVRPVLLDIEELNRRATNGEFALTKLSVGAMAAVGTRYRPLRSGAALGHGVGPLVVARTPMSLPEAVQGRVAIPGRHTTAYALLRAAAPPGGHGGGDPLGPHPECGARRRCGRRADHPREPLHVR
jgi:1,4-dihydroxy-6-naphthoate synthase